MLFNLFMFGYEGMTLFAVVVAYVLAIMFAISSHEYAHALVAYKQGDDTPKLAGRLTLNPLAHLDWLGAIFLIIIGFGWAKPVQCNPLKFKKYRSGMVKVSIAGVITNLIIAIVFSFFYALAFIYADPTTTIGVFLVQFCFYTCIISFCLAIFNLLPIPPLDGYMLIASLSKTRNKFLEFMQKYGMIILIVIIISPLYDIIFNFLYSVIIGPFELLWLLIL